MSTLAWAADALSSGLLSAHGAALLQGAAAAPIDVMPTAGAMNRAILWLEWTGLHMSPWKLIGLTGALMFGARWLVQLVASRRHRKPVIPRAFWYMSLVGSVMTLSYFVFSQKQDSVGVIQNLFPAFTAAYSLYLDIRHRGWHRDRAGH